jgi:hypothetical protein
MAGAISLIGGELKSGQQYTVDLPVLGGVAYKIDCSNEMLSAIILDAKVDFYWVMAETDAQAAVLLAAVGTRFSSKAGFYEFSISNVKGSLYYMSQGAVEVAGLSYTYAYLV